MKMTEVVERVRRSDAPRVEVTGGEPLLQPGVYPLMEALLAEGLVVLLETSGAIDVRLVPPAVPQDRRLEVARARRGGPQRLALPGEP